MSSIDPKSETRRIIENCGALIEDDHFVYASGDHGNGWIAKDVINLDPRLPLRLGQLLAEAVSDLSFEVVCGPAMGGLLCAQYTSLALEKTSVFAERAVFEDQDAFTLKRGYDSHVKGRRVLVVDDIVNTGFSIRLTRDAIARAGGQMAGAATWVSRGNVGAEELGMGPYIFLDEVALPSWPATSCPLCAQGKPINTQYAHGAEFLEQH